MGKTVKAIGLMSGTSLDGVDAALLETDGEGVVLPGPALTLPYLESHKKILREALALAPLLPPGARPEAIRRAERVVDITHAVAVKALRREAGLVPAQVDFIGFHGQTILHRPVQRFTWQIGNGRALARMTGIAVVNDFRSADVAAGGQGAPLVPLFHAALARERYGAELPVAVVNIGGVSNVTYVGEETLLAFDTGPGNAPIDDWALKHTGRAVDESGMLARRGRIDHRILDRMMAHEFFDRAPPKSLDRMDFSTEAVADLSMEDGAATLTAFTAAAIAKARAHFPEAPRLWIVCGGGRLNPVLMDALRARLNVPVIAAEDAGWRGDFIEAEAFAYLAVRTVKGLPLSLPTTTGVPEPMTGGRVHKIR